MRNTAYARRSAPSEGARPEKPSTGALRSARELKLWAGPGSDMPCDLCRVMLESTGTEFEVDAELDGHRVTLHFHQRCYEIWKKEKAAVPSAARIAGTAA